MWLLHAQSFLDEAYAICRRYFLNDLAPSYIILSHTWVDDQEVLFDELVDPSQCAKGKSGFAKHRYMARLAIEEELDWFWIDTSCINKDSSAELQETINSMYAIYKQATTCVAYLADVPREPASRSSCDISRDDVFVAMYSLLYDRDVFSEQQSMDQGSQDGWTEFVPLEQRSKVVQDLREHAALRDWTRKLADSRWFTRGWTLQELISPFDVRFYDGTWRFIGSKQDRKFARLLELPTGIAFLALINFDARIFSVADRMSWASRRETTRGEDIAYSLMGLFGINMPLLYGEGSERAFARLQRHLIEEGCDNTIFLWTDPNGTRGTYSGALARHPSRFKTSTCYSQYFFPGGSFQADMNTMIIAGGFEFTASLIPMNCLGTYMDSISLYSPLTREADFELRTLYNNPDLFLFCVSTQGERPLNQEEQFIIAGVVLKQLNKGRSQYARVFTAYILHIKLDWTNHGLCSLLRRIMQERIRIRNEIRLDERHETNVELYGVMFKKGVFYEDSKGQVVLTRIGTRRPDAMIFVCRQLNPWCFQVVVDIDIESLATYHGVAHCVHRAHQHRLMLSYVSATGDNGQQQRAAQSVSSIINKTLIEADEGLPTARKSAPAASMIECPGCSIGLNGLFGLVVERDRAMLHVRELHFVSRSSDG